MTRAAASPAAVLIAIAFALTSCERVDPLAPPTVYYGEDVCAVCGMIVSDERFAAAAIHSAGTGHEARVFDDIGCLLRDDAESPGAAARYVRAMRADRWLPLDDAWFVHSRELHTPMASGVAAAPSMEMARALLDDYPGVILDLAALRRRHAADDLRVLPGPDAVTRPAGDQG